MSLKQIKSTLQSERGFTIVELLIVVVVIAILAAITIVSYNGITTKANGSAAKALASSVQKKAELYFGEVGSYPTGQAQFQAAGKSYDISADSFTTNATTDPIADNGTKKVKYSACGATGGRITYYDYEKSTTPKLTDLTVGTGC